MTAPYTSGLFDDSVADIAAAYERLGHTLGWRFLNVSRAVLDAPVRIALITINPGGNSIPVDHPAESCEDGASYLVERWHNYPPGQATLQIQVQALFRMLASEIGFIGTHSELLEQSLISQFVPFRSPRIADLPRQSESLEFSRRLWARILPIASPLLIICLGRDVQRELRSLIPSAMGATQIDVVSYPTGWGKYAAEIDQFDRSGSVVRLLYLPHLSTWTLFTSKKCKQYIPAIIHAAAKDA